MSGDVKRRRTSMSLRERTRTRESTRSAAIAESPSTPQTPAPPPASSTTPKSVVRSKSVSVQVEEVQPVVSYSGLGPMPSVTEAQHDKELQAKDWKSIAESGLMQLAFERSRDKWLSGDMFDTFYTKPGKKRTVDEAKNPPKDSMVLVGVCTLVIEPHVFDVKLHTVKDRGKEAERERTFQEQQHQYQYQQTQFAQQARPQVAPQYYSNGATHPYASYSHQQSPVSHGSASQLPLLHAQHNHVATSTPRQDHHAVNGSLAPTTQRLSSQSQPQYLANGSPANITAPGRSSQTPSKPRATHASGTDPVVQMLATKASSNPELKTLMRIVASGQATTEQLKTFQVEIDILTPIAEAAAKARANAVKPNVAQSSQAQNLSPSVKLPPVALKVEHDAHTLQPNPSNHGHGILSNGHTHNTVMSPQPRIHANTVPKPKQLTLAEKKHLDISHVLFSFIIATSGDRYSIPKNSIIEYRSSGHELLVSYLHVDETTKTYQPLTLKFQSANSKFLEPFSRVLNDPESVRKHMEDVMTKYSKLSTSYIMIRLKKEEQEQEDDADLHSKKRIAEEQEARKERSSQSSTPFENGVPDPATVLNAKSRRSSGMMKAKVARPKKSGIIEIDSLLPHSKPKLKIPRSRRGRIADPSKSCYLCHTNNTSLWRKADIDGLNVTLCNACGIRWRSKHDADGNPKPTVEGEDQMKSAGESRQLFVPAEQQFAYRDVQPQAATVTPVREVKADLAPAIPQPTQSVPADEPQIAKPNNLL